MDVREVAVTLDVSEGTVKSALYRARAALAVALGESDDEEEQHVEHR